MRFRILACLGLILAWTDVAFAQTWQDAYARHDYPTAARLLQTEVFEHSPHGGARYPNLQAIQTLAEMYALGRGVPQDARTACALSNLGSGAAVYQHGERDQRTTAIQKQVEAYCVPLTPAERREAMNAGGCFQQGPAPAVLVSSPGRRIELERSRLVVTDRRRTREYSLAPLLRCAQQVPLVRHVRVAPPKGSRLPAREFIQIYSWHSNVKDGVRSRTLEWSAIELTAESLIQRARTLLVRSEGSTWPARPVPVELTGGATFLMHKSGDVRWRLATGRSVLHGLIGRPGTLRASTSLR
jgi:hypothetical protein